jgi:hypothetical protein
MRLNLKVLSIVGIVLGSCALLGTLSEVSAYEVALGLISGGLFIVWGVVGLNFISETDKAIKIIK